MSCISQSQIEHEELRDLLTWYWTASDLLWESLPITTEGATYTHWWQLDFEDRLLPLCRSGQASTHLIRAYIYADLKRVARGIRGSNHDS